MRFLSEVAEKEEINKMSIKNLGIIFGPIIFRLSVSSDTANVGEQLDFSLKGSNCVEKMITNYRLLFDENEVENNSFIDKEEEHIKVEANANASAKTKSKVPTNPYVYINYDSKKMRRDKKKGGLEKSSKLTRSLSDDQIPKIDLPCNFERDVIARIQKATKKQEEKEEQKEKISDKKKKLRSPIWHQ